MRIKDVYNSGIDTVLPSDIPQFIRTTEWYSIVEEWFDGLLLQMKGGYMLNLPRLNNTFNDMNEVVGVLNRVIKFHFVSRFYEYSKLYSTTQLEYNPIWNVDGTVKTVSSRDSILDRTSERNNTIEHSDTGEQVISKMGEDTLHRTGDNTHTKKGTDTTTKNSEEVTVKTGTDTLQKRGTITESVHTDFLTAPMDVDSYVKDRREEKSTTTAYTEPTDTTIYDTKEDGNNEEVSEVVFDELDTDVLNTQDVNKYSSTDTNEHSTVSNDDIKENVKLNDVSNDKFDELVTRQGNIGVTSTQQLIREERDIVNFSFLEKIVNDVAKKICVVGGVYSI